MPFPAEEFLCHNIAAAHEVNSNYRNNYNIMIMSSNLQITISVYVSVHYMEVLSDLNIVPFIGNTSGSANPSL